MDLLFLLAIFALMWLLFIRPQQRRVRAQRELVSSLEPGDEVVTAGGVIGRVRALTDDEMTVEVAPGVELRMLRGAISRRLGPERADELGPAEES